MTTTTSTPAVTGSGLVLDPGTAWQLNPRVAVRPEPFGALLYHFGTRRLSFLKDTRLVELVTALADFPSVDSTFAALGVEDGARPGYVSALQRLAETDMLLPAPRHA
ncbi:mycofactocin biosynthesis chaperone MftB [Citricoccus nitrophenolicus]|uniref:Mycofactocin biosynthesis chaperone MftB n=1 Tax=Citricoccus nitrophenolicus TaxID=863575 RepID=A0ABV0IDT1_9MICC|nr:mycofactocin biosynthesis chaperone MftB [Citricoccus sp. I39-566]WMY77210.1 mycofactocin biosynthesis chaperone MftB [Citricoccus sp. I39-566]